MSNESLELAERLSSLATDTGRELTDGLRAGKRVLLEGAQGTALDLDHGTYPFVTSSNTTASGAGTGVGIGPTAIDSVVGVVKAYTTRVGNGPLPSGFEPEMDQHIRDLGGEYGATTGRPRRCGWFDAVLARYSARVNGLTGVAVTKLDVLDTIAEVSIAVAYSTRRRRYHRGVPGRYMVAGVCPAALRNSSWVAGRYHPSKNLGGPPEERPSLSRPN